MSALGRWLAGMTRRWHQNPSLCHTVDPTDGHSNRMCKLALELDPDLSREALIYAIKHDDGETGLGDVSGWYKRENPAFAAMLAEAESENRDRLGIVLPDLSEYEAGVIRLADKLDAYLWMMHHAPKLAETEDWKAARMDMVGMASQILSTHGATAFNELINSHNGT